MSSADKTHDAGATLADLAGARGRGVAPLRRRARRLAMEDRALADGFAARLPGPVAARLSALVDELERA